MNNNPQLRQYFPLIWYQLSCHLLLPSAQFSSSFLAVLWPRRIASPSLFFTMVHKFNIKFSSTNDLLWYAQVHPHLANQKFLPLVDGLSKPLPESITNPAGDSIPNPEYDSRISRDQLLKLFLIYGRIYVSRYWLQYFL